jgi:hypothetical protein
MRELALAVVLMPVLWAILVLLLSLGDLVS